MKKRLSDKMALNLMENHNSGIKEAKLFYAFIGGNQYEQIITADLNLYFGSDINVIKLTSGFCNIR